VKTLKAKLTAMKRDLGDDDAGYPEVIARLSETP
jgi:hypothetical protein